MRLEFSNGILNRKGLLSFLFIAQFIAYSLNALKSYFSIIKHRVHFSIQVILTGYFLSALSKLHVSGFNWILDGRKMSLQILKSFHGKYTNQGDKELIEQGKHLANVIIEQPNFTFSLLLMSLLLELCSILFIFAKRKTLIIYGFLLLGMHFGIYYVMHIKVISIMIPMIIIFINPLYIVWLSFCKKPSYL